MNSAPVPARDQMSATCGLFASSSCGQRKPGGSAVAANSTGTQGAASRITTDAALQSDARRATEAGPSAVWIEVRSRNSVTVFMGIRSGYRTLRAMLQKFLFVFVLMSLALLNLSCGQSLSWRAVEAQIRSRFPDVQQLSTDSLAAMIARGDRPILLDVRTQAEYNVSHLPGARRLDPEATTFPTLEAVPHDTPIVLYCSVGYRSSSLAQRLQEKGFANVANLEGSIFRWANEGRVVVRSNVVVHKVHPYNALWGRLLNSEYRAAAPPADN